MIQDNGFNLQFVGRVIQQYKWYIIGVTVAAGVAAFVCTLPFIYPPQFRSSTVIFPANAERFDGTKVFEQKTDLYFYGGSDDVERLANIAKSEDVAMFVIDSLDLWTAYKIDKNSVSPKFYAMEEFRSNVNISKAEGYGLSIEAYDTDPQRAADIVNLMVAKIDVSSTDLLRKNKDFMRKMLEKGEQTMTIRIQKMQDSVRLLRNKYNVLNNTSQTEMLLEQVFFAEGKFASEKARLAELQKYLTDKDTTLINTKARVKGYEAQLNALTKPNKSNVNLSSFRDGVDIVDGVENTIFNLLSRREDVREKIKQLEAMQGEVFSNVLTIETAHPADRKARPVRWVILLASVLMAAFVSSAACVLWEGIKAKEAA